MTVFVKPRAWYPPGPAERATTVESDRLGRKTRLRHAVAEGSPLPASVGRSETDPLNRSGERKRGRREEGDHVTACAAPPGPDDTHATRSLADVLRRRAGCRCRLPAARDVAPHHAPCGSITAQRGDTSVDVTDARSKKRFLALPPSVKTPLAKEMWALSLVIAAPHSAGRPRFFRSTGRCQAGQSARGNCMKAPPTKHYNFVTNMALQIRHTLSKAVHRALSAPYLWEDDTQIES
jgi:hypothetical protein